MPCAFGCRAARGRAAAAAARGGAGCTRRADPLGARDGAPRSHGVPRRRRAAPRDRSEPARRRGGSGRLRRPPGHGGRRRVGLRDRAEPRVRTRRTARRGRPAGPPGARDPAAHPLRGYHPCRRAGDRPPGRRRQGVRADRPTGAHRRRDRERGHGRGARGGRAVDRRLGPVAGSDRRGARGVAAGGRPAAVGPRRGPRPAAFRPGRGERGDPRRSRRRDVVAVVGRGRRTARVPRCRPDRPRDVDATAGRQRRRPAAGPLPRPVPAGRAQHGPPAHQRGAAPARRAARPRGADLRRAVERAAGTAGHGDRVPGHPVRRRRRRRPRSRRPPGGGAEGVARAARRRSGLRGGGRRRRRRAPQPATGGRPPRRGLRTRADRRPWTGPAGRPSARSRRATAGEQAPR